jgi:hypothetical protein
MNGEELYNTVENLLEECPDITPAGAGGLFVFRHARADRNDPFSADLMLDAARHGVCEIVRELRGANREAAKQLLADYLAERKARELIATMHS